MSEIEVRINHLQIGKLPPTYNITVHGPGGKTVVMNSEVEGMVWHVAQRLAEVLGVKVKIKTTTHGLLARRLAPAHAYFHAMAPVENLGG